MWSASSLPTFRKCLVRTLSGWCHTLRSIPKDSRLHNRCRENLKSHHFRHVRCWIQEEVAGQTLTAIISSKVWANKILDNQKKIFIYLSTTWRTIRRSFYHSNFYFYRYIRIPCLIHTQPAPHITWKLTSLFVNKQVSYIKWKTSATRFKLSPLKSWKQHPQEQKEHRVAHSEFRLL
jgi:hypothetical protein